MSPANEDKVIDKPKKTTQAKKMSAGLSQVASSKPSQGAKGPAGNLSQRGKKTVSGTAGASGKAMGMSATKAKRPGK